MDLNSILGMTDSLGALSGTLGSILNVVAFVGNIIGFIIFAILGVTYALNGFQNMHIGRKAGLDKDWMPFVPFAHTIYRLQMVNEQWWKMFFLEFSWLYGGIVYMIINAISNGKWQTFGIIVLVFYAGCCIAYRIYYRWKFYKAFNVQPVLCLLFLSIWFPFVRVFDLFIAFTDNFSFSGDGMSQTVSGTARSVVNVRDGGGQNMGQGKAEGGSVTGMSGMYTGQTLPLMPKDEMVIGRDNALCNLIIDQSADKVSRKHCGVIFDPVRNVYQVTDYSSNGTFQEGGNRLVANAPTTMQRGTVISLGSRENRFRLN